MKRISKNKIEITQEELSSIQAFIELALDRDWDRHTNTYICTCSWEEGKRKMDPEMYDLAAQMNLI